MTGIYRKDNPVYLNTLTAMFETALSVTFDASVAALSAVCASAGIVTLDRWQNPAMSWAARGSSGRNECGEGVISAAIAVLIIASLGALMWVGFKALWENAEEATNSEIAKIGK
ncbi:hypothetical protein [Candidatus Poriferisodalis sp.]|uniref:hypothetical protein n=1 Tax=Candidatus Poriferisodalis sp. TaxID=3101277 RepID=UPI003C6F60F2